MLETLQLDDPEIAVTLRVDARARRFTLRLAHDGAGAVLTLPPGVPAGEVRRFLARQQTWLRSALARQPNPIAVVTGSVLPVDGVALTIVARTGARRAPVLEPGRIVLQGAGPAGPRLATWLKGRARDRLVPLVGGHARTLGAPLAGVSLKDTRSRWGSCSTAGRINLSWRLAMAPPEVQDYVAAHEAAHLVEMNHQPEYWAVLARLVPGYAGPRAWLRQHGRALHAYRFDGTTGA